MTLFKQDFKKTVNFNEDIKVSFNDFELDEEIKVYRRFKMNRICVLDCTLRDGGYVNNFNFGKNTMKEIVKKLSKASIDIIECGFLKSGAFDEERSLFGNIDLIKRIIGKKNPNVMYVGMIQYGAISSEEIKCCDPDSIDGIRVTFHEHEIDLAFVLGKQLMEKGYKVFMQPVGTTTYTDEALLKLVNRINELKPFAFYLVDTLGTMYKNDLLRMFYLVDKNLNKNIVLGFHSHNNLQLSFANAQELIQLNTPRRLIIDSSVFGMGRGAGNLNTELVTQYINTNLELRYDNAEILEIIDEHIKPISYTCKWGYDIAYYIASITGCHPNYATFLLNKHTIQAREIYSILSKLDVNRRALFDKKYIEKEYLGYMNHHIDDKDTLKEIKEIIGDKQVLLLAPGKSLNEKKSEIDSIIHSENFFTMSINFTPKAFPVNMVFISNMKRFKELGKFECKDSEFYGIVVTSNISLEQGENKLIVDFSAYTNEEQCIVDNAGLMCINLLKKIGVSDITLAGFDGFSPRIEENYFDSSMYLDVETERIMNMNEAISRKLVQLSSQMNIKFLSDSVYQRG